ncbi:hypothetical protein BDZ94DRAFT_1225739 [Collybia nuda]|uniref:Uncharacterized protein n=1 Tax=Collybia nuda TaxID=64659 RepID=A0A9P5XW15_9AGAR|nr:hypothetical protein BDZ94DRAFT_1225739 [Collybia nuda]
MGRPRLYHTPDEKREANRRKSKRHYDKEKKSVRMRQSITYCKDKECTPGSLNDVNYWSAQAGLVELKFMELIGKSPFDYVDSIYRCYLVSPNTNVFHDATNSISEVQSSIRRHQDKILQLTGVDENWE